MPCQLVVYEVRNPGFSLSPSRSIQSIALLASSWCGGPLGPSGIGAIGFGIDPKHEVKGRGGGGFPGMQVSGVTVLLCTAPPALDIPDMLKYNTLLHSLRTRCTPPAAAPDIQGIQFVLGS